MGDEAQFRHRPVLVTGAGSGIGLTTALHLAELGFPTWANVRTPDGSERLRVAAQRAGVCVEPLIFDVADPAAVQQALEDRHFYALVNNAGYFNAGAIEDVSSHEAARQLQVMAVAPMQLACQVLPAMRLAGEGRIVNITSAITSFNVALTGWYQASKQALAAATEALRMETAGSGVEVVQVEPGAINTGIWQKAEQDLQQRRVSSSLPCAYDRALAVLHRLHGRMHSPEAVAETIARALSTPRPRARYRVGAESGVLAAAGITLPPCAKDGIVRRALRL